MQHQNKPIQLEATRTYYIDGKAPFTYLVVSRFIA